MLKVTPIHRTLFNNQRRQQTFFTKKLKKPLTSEPNRGTVKSKIKKEREKMTVQIKKKFDSIDDGINNMLDAAAWDYSDKKFTHTTASDFRDKFIVKVGQKYIKIGRKSDYNSDKMGQVWAFVVNTDDDKKFKKGDVLKAAGFNAPARNAPRGNVLDGGFNINWTGPLYL